MLPCKVLHIFIIIDEICDSVGVLQCQNNQTVEFLALEVIMLGHQKALIETCEPTMTNKEGSMGHGGQATGVDGKATLSRRRRR